MIAAGNPLIFGGSGFDLESWPSSRPVATGRPPRDPAPSPGRATGMLTGEWQEGAGECPPDGQVRSAIA